MINEETTSRAPLKAFFESQVKSLPSTRRQLLEAADGQFGDALLEVLRVYGRDGQWLKLAEAAELSETSVRSLQRKLSSEDRDNSELANQVRVELATVRDTRQSIAAIAKQLGYATQGNFSRAFKQRTRTTPSEYRNQHQHPNS